MLLLPGRQAIQTQTFANSQMGLLKLIQIWSSRWSYKKKKSHSLKKNRYPCSCLRRARSLLLSVLWIPALESMRAFHYIGCSVNSSSRKGPSKSYRLREVRKVMGCCVFTVSILKGVLWRQTPSVETSYASRNSSLQMCVTVTAGPRCVLGVMCSQSYNGFKSPSVVIAPPAKPTVKAHKNTEWKVSGN